VKPGLQAESALQIYVSSRIAAGQSIWSYGLTPRISPLGRVCSPTKRENKNYAFRIGRIDRAINDFRPGCNGAREIAKIRESERHEDRDRLLAER